MTDWILVEDRLPEPHKPGMVYSERVLAVVRDTCEPSDDLITLFPDDEWPEYTVKAAYLMRPLGGGTVWLHAADQTPIEDTLWIVVAWAPWPTYAPGSET